RKASGDRSPASIRWRSSGVKNRTNTEGSRIQSKIPRFPKTYPAKALGWSDWEGTEEFHGTEMYWSHYPAEASASLVAQAGFTLLRSEPRYPGDGIHCWVLARKTQI
ncbi:MAG TPA: hypothetical protein VGX03_29580, partial [Candidatus Binatia bacterium]|nr:hypothetical protein [Candidatus Binatia bacterium]